jgi:hypothetical protein
MNHKRLIVIVVVAGLAAGMVALTVPGCTRDQDAENRRVLFDEVQPVRLANCDFERIGDANDGGYLICANLLGREESGYSYGINGNDEWGCSIASRLKVPMHQYDCFNIDRPACGRGTMVFHEECIGPARLTEHGRVFDTMAAQIARNGDANKRLIVKMDVEGAEWSSLTGTSDAALNQIGQLVVEFHNVRKARFIETIRRLKRVFHVAHVHYNNWACDPAAAPFPSLAFEVLFVNKDLGVVDPAGPVILPHPLDAPNNAKLHDCQATP